MAFAISTSNVSATHTSSATIAPTLTHQEKSYIFTIAVKNESGDDINSVKISVIPSDFEVIGGISEIPKDNTVENENVWLFDGTELVVGSGSLWLTIPENTEVKLPKGTHVSVKVGENTYDAEILEDTTVKVRTEGTLELGPDNTLRIENGQLVTLSENKLALVKATRVVSADGTATIIEDTTVRVLENENVGLGAENILKLVGEKPARWTTNELATIGDTKVKLGAGGPLMGTVQIIGTGENLDAAENIILVDGTKLTSLDTFTTNENLRIVKDTEVELKAETIVDLPSETQDDMFVVPKGWSFSANQWTGIEDNVIAAGKSLEFPVAIKTSEAGGEYDLTILTKDVPGYPREMKTNKITVDNTAPSIDELTVDKEYVSKAASIKITLKASEALVEAPLVWVQQDGVTKENAKENFRATMTSADDITWTGTYTTIDKVEDFDNFATIWVENMVDAVAHASSEENVENAFFVDTLAPPVLTKERDNLRLVDAENIDNEITDLLTLDGNQTNISAVVLTGRTVDNVLKEIENKAGLTVEAFLNDALAGKVTSMSDNTFNIALTLNEGLNEIKVRVTDEAGNVGEDNILEWFCDSKKPVITSISIAGKPYVENMVINVQKPVIKLTISDPGYPENKAIGVENKENHELRGAPIGTGYTVQIWKLENSENSIELTNATPWIGRAGGAFENACPEELADTWHKIFVAAGDGMQVENMILRFEIDITAPSAPTVTTGSILEFTTAVKPYVTREPSVSISGAGDPGDWVNIYLNDETTPTETAKVASAGTWSAKISLTGGHVTKISVSETDVAGNESAKEVWGYAMSDATAPTVTLATLPETTDKTSVILSGTVDKEDWEDWSDITLTVQVGIGSVEVQIGAEGSYSCSVPLSMGVNTITVRATDSIGNVSLPASATVERVFTMDASAPSVTLEALPEATDKVSITIEGTVTKDDWESWSDITLTVQVGTGKVQVPIGAGGSYNYSIELAEGPNMIVVQATDAVGNAGNAVSDMVERTTTPWGIYAIIFVIIALILAAIAVFKGPRSWKR